jgi:hypothetical protein
MERSLFQYQLSDSIFLSPGHVTIQCGTVEQLYQQVEILSKALRERSDDVRKRVELATPKRPARSEIQTPIASAKTA